MMTRQQGEPPEDSRVPRLKLSCHQTVTTRIGQSRELSWLSQLVDENKESIWKSLTDERLVAEGEALFESADQQGYGVIYVTRLRMALLSCKWCAFSQKRVQDLFEHLGPSCYDDFSEVTREEFSTAFVEYVKWLIKTCQASPDNFYDARRSSSSSSITGSVSQQQPRPPAASPLCSGVAAARFLGAAKKGNADGNQTYSNDEINLEAQKLMLAGADHSRRGCRHKMMSSSPQRQKMLLSQQPAAPSSSSDRKRSLRLGSPLDAEIGPRIGSAAPSLRASSTAATGVAGSIPSTPMVPRRRRSCPKSIGTGSRGTSSDGAPALHQRENPTADDSILMQRRRHSETDTCLDERKRGLPSAGSRPLLPSSSMHSRHGAWQSSSGTFEINPMKPISKDNPWSGINDFPSGKSSSAARRPKLSPRKSSSQSSDEMIVAHQGIRPGKGAAMVRLEQQHVTREQMRAFKGMPVEVDGTVRIQEFEKHLSKRAPRLAERAKKYYGASSLRCSRRPAVVRGLDLEKLLPRLFPDASKAEIKAIIDVVIRPASSKSPCSALTKNNGRRKCDPRVAEALAVFEYMKKSHKEQCLTYEECEQGMQMTGMGSEELECSLEELFYENEDGTMWKAAICLEEFTRWFTSAENGNLLLDSQ